MNKLTLFFSILLAASLVLISACGEDDPDKLQLVSIEATGTELSTGNTITKDLNGSSAAVDVPTDAEILVTFNKNVKFESINGNVEFSAAGGSISHTADEMVITFGEPLERGTTYTLTFKSGLEAEDGGSFDEISRTFTTEGRAVVVPPQSDKQVGFWAFNGNTDPSVGDFTTTKEQVSYATDRYGQLNSALYFGGAPNGPGTGDIVDIEGDGLISPSMTISVWFRVNTGDFALNRFVFGVGVERGYFMEFGDPDIPWMKFATCHALDPDPSGHSYGTRWSDPNGVANLDETIVAEWEGSYTDWFSDSEIWHHLVMSYDANTSMKSIYIDGTLIMQENLKGAASQEWWMGNLELNEISTVGLVEKLGLGWACSSDNTSTSWADYPTGEDTYIGYLDDLRLFNVGLSKADVETLYNDEKP